MNKIYYIYAMIPEYIYNQKIKYLLSSSQYDFRWKHGKMYGLYAWTTSKKMMKEFFEVRDNKIYNVIKNDMYDKEELDRLKSNYPDLELGYRRYYYDDCENEEDSILITSTKNEHINSTEFPEEYLYEFGPKASDEFVYYIFKDKIIKALDILGYTTSYDIEYGTEAENDAAQYNLSFNLTKYGNKHKIKFTNQMNRFLV